MIKRLCANSIDMHQRCERLILAVGQRIEKLVSVSFLKLSAASVIGNLFSIVIYLKCSATDVVMLSMQLGDAACFV